MRKIFKLSLSAVGALVACYAGDLLRAPLALADDAICNVATLKGRYIFAYDGFSVGDKGQRSPFAYAGQEIYDGRGSGTGVTSSSINGKISRYVPYDFIYSINPDCTGESTFNQAGETSHYDIFVSPSGDQFVFIETDAGFVDAGTQLRVARRVQ